MQLIVDALFSEDLLELFTDMSACEANRTRDKWQPVNPGMQLKVDTLFFEDLLKFSLIRLLVKLIEQEINDTAC